MHCTMTTRTFMHTILKKLVQPASQKGSPSGQFFCTYRQIKFDKENLSKKNCLTTSMKSLAIQTVIALIYYICRIAELATHVHLLKCVVTLHTTRLNSFHAHLTDHRKVLCFLVCVLCTGLNGLFCTRF